MLEERDRLQRRSAPHVLLQRELEERGWDADAVASRCELDADEVARVLTGELVITRARHVRLARRWVHRGRCGMTCGAIMSRGAAMILPRPVSGYPMMCARPWRGSRAST